MVQPHPLNMQNKPTQSLKQTQRMIMSPQMQQAIRILQVPIMELSQVIDLELEQNPVLEHSDENFEADDERERLEESIEEYDHSQEFEQAKELDFGKQDYDTIELLNDDYHDLFYESENYSLRRTASEEKLKSFLENNIEFIEPSHIYLLNQAREQFDDPKHIEAAEAIIYSLDEKGFFTTDLQELSVLTGISLDLLIEILPIIQTFDPVGIASINLKESLLSQLRTKQLEHSLAFQIIHDHFDDLLHNRIRHIASSTRCGFQTVLSEIENVIVKLDLRPGLSIGKTLVQNIVPDLHIFLNESDALQVRINDEFIPNIRINLKYLKMLHDTSVTEETRDFIKQKISSAKWLVKNIFQRNETLERIGDRLIDTQGDFLKNPNGQLIPMTMKAFADYLEVHESTIARAVSNKYLACDRGIFPLRYFFSSSIGREDGTEMSSKSVKEMISHLIENENKLRPLSDELLSKLLKDKGVCCARRTVAKYRSELNVGNAHQRKKFV